MQLFDNFSKPVYFNILSKMTAFSTVCSTKLESCNRLLRNVYGYVPGPFQAIRSHKIGCTLQTRVLYVAVIVITRHTHV